MKNKLFLVAMAACVLALGLVLMGAQGRLRGSSPRKTRERHSVLSVARRFVADFTVHNRLWFDKTRIGSEL
jgi:hypothetical protein